MLEKNYELYPDFRPLQIQYAEALMHANNSHKAINLLQNILMNDPDNIELNQLLASAQANAGQMVDAYQTQAKVSLLQGNKERALLQLQQALKLPGLDHDTRLIIQSQIREVVFSCSDPNPLVNKKSEEILKKNNIKVFSGVIQPEGIELNKFFFKWIKSKQP